VSLQGGGGARQSHAGKGVVVGEGGVPRAPGSVGRPLVDVLPVGVQGGRVRWVRAKQEGVQLAHHLLADARLELAGEEGRPRDLLEGGGGTG